MSSVAKKQLKKQTDKISNKRAEEFTFKSRLVGGISDLSLLEKSLFFAEVSLISYLGIAECNKAAGMLGFQDGKFFECDGSQAYWFQTETDSVIACRGTEANEWNDIRADANALTALAETVGKGSSRLQTRGGRFVAVPGRCTQGQQKKPVVLPAIPSGVPWQPFVPVAVYCLIFALNLLVCIRMAAHVSATEDTSTTRTFLITVGSTTTISLLEYRLSGLVTVIAVRKCTWIGMVGCGTSMDGNGSAIACRVSTKNLFPSFESTTSRIIRSLTTSNTSID